MRINRLVLRSFRGIGHAEVAFAPTGVTIVEGDNEAGKTSLTEAVDIVLTVRDDSKRSVVKALQPVGRDVGPEVTIDLTTGPYRFVLHKRWLRRPETTLEILEPARATLTGREAHDRAQEILAETLDVDLWRALRLEQGADPGHAAFNVPTLGRALDLAAGGEHGSDREDHLWDRIVEERNRYWTPTGRPSAERERLAARLAEAGAAVRAIEAELRELEAQTDDMARLEREAQELAVQQRELDAQVGQLSERAEEVAALQRDLARQEAELRGLAAERDRAQSLHDARAALVTAVADGRERLADTEALLRSSEPDRAAAGRRQAEAVTARDRALDALRTADAAHRLALADLDHRRRQIEVAQLAERHQRVTEQRHALAAAEAVLEEVAIDAAALAAIEDAHLEVVRAEAAASAGAPTVTITAVAASRLEVDGAPVELSPGAVHEISVAAVTEITLPEQMRIGVRAGAESQALHDRRQRAEGALRELCQRWGVADLADARVAAGRRVDAERIRRDASERIVADLRDLSVDDLARKVQRVGERVAAYDAARAPEPPVPASFDDAQVVVAAAEERLDEARVAAAAAEAALAAALSDVREVEVTNAGLLERARLERDALAHAEAALSVARATADDEAVEAALAAAVDAHHVAADHLAVASRSLQRHDPTTVADLLVNATSARDRGRVAVAANRDARQRLESVLETKGEQGLSQRRDTILTERARLQREHDRLEGRADAARLLHDTFDARRREAHARYVAPFKAAIEGLGRVVFGPSLEIELDADLRIASRTLEGTTLPFSHLSTGAREQLGIIARLACATIVAGTDGAPVLLDDTLGWTDPTRLAQMAAAIGLAGRTCQVVLLTCTPGRFANVGAATTVRLPTATEPAGARESA